MMRRVDVVVMRRFIGRVLMVVLLFFSLFSLIESLDTGRVAAFSRLGGPQLGLLAIVIGGGRLAIGTLPVSVLLGTIVAALDLQSRREMTIIKATGASIWGVMRMPLITVLIVGLLVSFFADAGALRLSRVLPYLGTSQHSEFYIEQTGSAGAYILRADNARTDKPQLDGVTIYFTSTPSRDRIVAESARLTDMGWELANGTRYTPGLPPVGFATLQLPTETTPGDMQIRLTDPRALTIYELIDAVRSRIADPGLRAAAITSLFRLFALPLLLCGSVLMGFAFTAGYRRTNRYGGTVLYGVVLGFVVYVVTELATRSGFAGVLDPTFAAAGPAFVAIVIGLTVLLYKEDGRT